MRITIDGNDLVSDSVALQMALKVLERDDGTINFTQDLAVEIKTNKTSRSYKVVKQ